jgi:hypothetical protein
MEGDCLRSDIENWMPLTALEINEVFTSIPAIWGIAGGWAIDLHLGKVSREHNDIDVVFFREEQQVFYNLLKKNWMLYKAYDRKLIPWEEGGYLELTKDVWVSKNEDSPWAFQIMIIDCDNNDWVYGREKSIRKAKEKIFLKTREGIPYLKPELQLLYKGGSSKVREKDLIDFHTILPLLSVTEKEWLKESLVKQFTGNHSWFKYL